MYLLAKGLLHSVHMNPLRSKRVYTHQFKETARKDPYRSKSKPDGQPSCPVCKSVSVNGRWLSLKQYKTLHAAAPVEGDLKCPACKQLEDHFALGVIELHGKSWKAKKKDVMHTLRNTEKIARSRNDQERVLWISESEEVTKVYVSLPELARSIGHELGTSFQGEVAYRRSTEEPYLRVRWNSDSTLGEEEPPASHKSKSFRSRSRLHLRLAK